MHRDRPPSHCYRSAQLLLRQSCWPLTGRISYDVRYSCKIWNNSWTQLRDDWGYPRCRNILPMCVLDGRGTDPRRLERLYLWTIYEHAWHDASSFGALRSQIFSMRRSGTGSAHSLAAFEQLSTPAYESSGRGPRFWTCQGSLRSLRNGHAKQRACRCIAPV